MNWDFRAWDPCELALSTAGISSVAGTAVVAYGGSLGSIVEGPMDSKPSLAFI